MNFGELFGTELNLIEGGQIFITNLLRLGKHCLVFQISEYQAIFEYSHSL